MSINKRSIESLEYCSDTISDILEDKVLQEDVRKDLEELKMFIDLDIKEYKSELGWE